MESEFEVVVVGAGIIGLMAAAKAAERGKRVAVVEQHFPGTQEGSSAEHVRMWRTLYNEPNHSRLAYQAGDMYADLERTTGRKILHHHGLLNFGIETDPTPEGTLLAPIETLQELGKPYSVLTAREIEKKYPFRNLPSHYVGIYQPDNAVIDVKNAFAAAIEACTRHGVEFRNRSRVTHLENSANGVDVHLDSEAPIHADKVILASGAYTNQILLPSFGFELDLTIWDMCFAYYRLDGTARDYPMWFQFDRSYNGYSDLFYGFPAVDFGRPGFVRVAVDWASHVFSNVDNRHYAPPQIDLEIVRDFVQDRMVGLDSAPVDTGRALMAHLPDNASLLDYLPAGVKHRENITICAAGWAFKFAPLFGDICARMALGEHVSEDLSEFSLMRPGRVRSVQGDVARSDERMRKLMLSQQDSSPMGLNAEAAAL